MCYVKRDTRNCILKFFGKFSHGEQLQCSGPTEWSLMKSRFSVKFMWFFEKKNVTCCDWQEFFFISEGFWRFFLTRGYHWQSILIMMVIAKLSERNAQEYNRSTSSQRSLKKLVKMLLCWACFTQWLVTLLKCWYSNRPTAPTKGNLPNIG